MIRHQTFHETLIPMLVELAGATSYLEMGTANNETISKVKCALRYGVDTNPQPCEGVRMFRMTTQEFIQRELAALAPIDACFIDADHHPSRVMADFQGVWPHMRDEGLIFLHDCNPETWEDTESGLCDNAWLTGHRLHKMGIECIVLPYHPGLMIARKRISWGPGR